jgi:hypothetical protein
VDSTLADFPPSAASSHAARIGVVLIVLMFAPRILAFSTFPRTCGHALSVVLGHVLDSMRADKGLFLISGCDVSTVQVSGREEYTWVMAWTN